MGAGRTRLHGVHSGHEKRTNASPSTGPRGSSRGGRDRSCLSLEQCRRRSSSRSRVPSPRLLSAQSAHFSACSSTSAAAALNSSVSYNGHGAKGPPTRARRTISGRPGGGMGLRARSDRATHFQIVEFGAIPDIVHAAHEVLDRLGQPVLVQRPRRDALREDLLLRSTRARGSRARVSARRHRRGGAACGAERTCFLTSYTSACSAFIVAIFADCFSISSLVTLKSLRILRPEAIVDVLRGRGVEYGRG